MPLYDYRCTQCQQVSELLVSSHATPACPLCGCERMERLISAPQAPGQSAGIIASARRQAAREGHFSHYAKSERPKLK